MKRKKKKKSPTIPKMSNFTLKYLHKNLVEHDWNHPLRGTAMRIGAIYTPGQSHMLKSFPTQEKWKAEKQILCFPKVRLVKV